MDDLNDTSKRQAMTGQWRTPPLPAFAPQQQQSYQQLQHPQQQQQQHQHHQHQHQNQNQNQNHQSNQAHQYPLDNQCHQHPHQYQHEHQNNQAYQQDHQQQQYHHQPPEQAQAIQQLAPPHQPQQVQQQQVMNSMEQQHSVISPSNSTMSISVPAIPSTVIEEIPLPESTDDYAKALQEAYRRGAEAAARMQQSQIMSASCPNLQQFQGQPNDPTLVNSYVPNPLSNHVSVPPPPNPMPIPITQTLPHSQPQHIPMQVMHQVPPPQQPPALQHPMNVTPTPQTAGSRSLSLPDMQSYAARANAEEEKRKKRLARNRASARLRRLRKKNLVDSYEGEVGVLEASLQKLKAHTWGTSHEALLEALSMERGQQELSNEERIQLIQDIIKQQREQVEFLRETQREQQVLLSLVENPDSEISQELQALLNLTDSQKENIRISCQGLDKEVEAMETFIQCLDAMKEKTWLWNEGVAQIANQFTSILHPNQLSKFLLWADTNAEALDTLEYCHAPPSQAPPANFPIFVFGMDDHGSHAPGNGED